MRKNIGILGSALAALLWFSPAGAVTTNTVTGGCPVSQWVNAVSVFSPGQACAQPQAVDIGVVGGVFTVSQGGTGAGTFTAHGVLVGEGTSPFTATATGSANQVFISGGAAADPSWSNAALVPNVTSGVDQVTINGSVAGTPGLVGIQATGTDANIANIIQAKGTGGVWLGSAGATANAGLQVATPAGTIVNQLVVTPAATGSTPGFEAGGASADAGVGVAFGTQGTGPIAFDTGTNVQQFSITHTGSAVNNLNVTGSIGTAVLPITATGTGANLPIGIFPKGTGSSSAVALGGTTVANSTAQFVPVASSVDFFQVTSAATANPAFIGLTGTGTDANVGLSIQTKGSGGSVFIGGAANANASLEAAVPAGTIVNHLIVTPSATTVVPSLTVGGASADANRNLNVAGIGTGIVTLGQPICTISGSTPQTCNGQRGIVTTGTLTTAAATDATPFVINNSSVGASSLVMCTVESYSGTYSTNGNPVIESCVPGSTTITVNLRNVNAANALNGTVGMGFVVLN